MPDRLFASVLGWRRPEKGSLWDEIFGRNVRTGVNSRLLQLRPNECVEVFLVNSSFEAREMDAGSVLDNQHSKIILCSITYTKEVRRTLEHVAARDFNVFTQCLMPGAGDPPEHHEDLGLKDMLLDMGATISRHSVDKPIALRAQEMKEFIYGWASFRHLVMPWNRKTFY